MFYDNSDFPFTQALEAHWNEIATEYRSVKKRMAPWVEGHLHAGGWSVFGIRAWPEGKEIVGVRNFAPFTAEAVSRIPGVAAAAFSRLAAGEHIAPHRGYQGRFLRCHLGLEVPPGDCQIRVLDERRYWQNGKCLVFDDRVEHEAWNRTAASRGVLLIDFAAG
jgi:ornithine lipid ester-linked acyl 2-hydroxylase